MATMTKEEFNKVLDGLVRQLVAVGRTENDILIRKVIESMEAMWKEIDEVLSPLWAKKQVIAILRDNKRKKILEDKKDG